jgi:hypothetical protein
MYQKFQNNNINFKDENRSGRPVKLDNNILNFKIEKLKKIEVDESAVW